MASRRAVCALPAVLLLAHCQTAPTLKLKHDAYIWQRVWNAQLRQAIQQQAPLFSELRCLAAQRSSSGAWIHAAIDNKLAKSLSSTRWIYVIRIEGSQPKLSLQELQREIANLRSQFGPDATFELDFDCASAQLSRYTALLKALKQAGESIRITALPSWQSSADLPALLELCDHVTLQVHSVEKPKMTEKFALFNPERALLWLRAFDALSYCDLSVALPTYGAQIYTDAKGQTVFRHESEFTQRSGSEIASGAQVLPDAPQLQRFLSALAARDWRKLKRVAWFRLTLASDRLALAPASLAALVQSVPLKSDIKSFKRANSVGGFDLFLRNHGNCAGVMPNFIATVDACAGAGLAGYDFQLGEKAGFARIKSMELKPGRVMGIGWVRGCLG